MTTHAIDIQFYFNNSALRTERFQKHDVHSHECKCNVKLTFHVWVKTEETECGVECQARMKRRRRGFWPLRAYSPTSTQKSDLRALVRRENEAHATRAPSYDAKTSLRLTMNIRVRLVRTNMICITEKASRTSLSNLL